MADGFFRSKSGFTVVQNASTRDRNLSLKAKGLYLVIQSYITMPDKQWKKEDFLGMSLEGEKAFESAWVELKEAGYLHVHFYAEGKKFYSEYELLDEPVEGPHTFYYNAAGELTKTNIDRAEARKERARMQLSDENGSDESENQRTPQNGGNAKSEGNQRIPRFGSNAEGTYADGTNGQGSHANGGNKETITPLDKTFPKNSTNSLFPEGEKTSACVSENTGTAVIFDPTKKVLPGDIFDIREEAKENGIPYEVCLDVERATKTILVLVDMEDLMKDCMEDQLRYDAAILAVKSLVEMITAQGVNTYYGAKVTYANVIDQLNIILKKNDYSLQLFVSTCADKFVENIKVKKITNHSGYMKSILWGNITSFSLEWNGFVHRTQAERWGQ